MKISRLDAFATPILTCRLENSESLNEALHQLIKSLMQSGSSLKNSNVGGFHSDTQFILRKDPSLQELRNCVLQMAKAMGQYYGLGEEDSFEVNLAGWANVMTHGNYHRLHSHPDCHWSGVYYVSIGKPNPDAPPNGNLQFQDPRSGANRLVVSGLEMSPGFSITPAPGLMVMFPSYLEHYVHPFFGEGERISVAFNIKVIKIHSAVKSK